MLKIDLTKLCYYDRRNPDFSIKEEYGYDKEEVEATGNFAKKDCACDNCFYGRSSLTEQLIKSQELQLYEQLQELYTKVENYANEVFGKTNNYVRSFRLEKGYIVVYDMACWHYCDSSDDEEFIITPEDLELPIEQAKEKYQKELQKKHEEEELRKVEAKLKEQKRKEEEEFKLLEILHQKFKDRFPK